MTWTLDKAHSKVSFTARHMMITNVHGEFKDFDATLQLDPEDLENSKIRATIDASSIDTGQPERDKHLRSTDFFSAEEHPQLTFESTSFRKTGDQKVELIGELSIRGHTSPVTLTGEQLGPVTNPLSGQKTVGYSLKGELNREDFGLTWNQVMEAGGVLVSKNIKIAIEAEAVEESGEA